MASQPNHDVDARLERASEIDDGAILRIRQIRPVERAASPIIDHNLELIDTAKSLRPWYVGNIQRTPRELMSELLDPRDNHACSMLTDFIGTVKRFSPGAFPGHCNAIRTLEFTTVQLIRTLSTIIDSPVFVDAIKRVAALSATLSDPANCYLSEHDLYRRFDTRLQQLIDSFCEISKAFHTAEKQRDIKLVFSDVPPEPATKDDVKNAAESAAKSAAEKVVKAVKRNGKKADALLTSAGETLVTVKRIDNRGKRNNPRQKFSVEVQEACFNYWEHGRHNSAIKENSTKKVRYEHVFNYFKKELAALGIKNAEMFRKALKLRSNRINRQATK